MTWGEYQPTLAQAVGYSDYPEKKSTADAVSSGHVFGPWTYNSNDLDWGFIRDADGLVTAIAKDNRVDQAEMAKARRGKYDPYAKQARLIALIAISFGILVVLMCIAVQVHDAIILFIRMRRAEDHDDRADWWKRN